MNYNNRNRTVFWNLHERQTSRIRCKYTGLIFKQHCYSSWCCDYKYSDILYSGIVRKTKMSSDNYGFIIL
jgi:hypothetical protein